MAAQYLLGEKHSFAEYWKHFMARLNGVHAFRYKSAGSEPIWMNLGHSRTWVHCLPLALGDSERDPGRSESEKARQNFVFFCDPNNARLYRFPVGQIIIIIYYVYRTQSTKYKKYTHKTYNRHQEVQIKSKYHEIRTQDVDLRGGESFRNNILKIFPKGIFFSKRQIWGEISNNLRLQIKPPLLRNRANPIKS